MRASLVRDWEGVGRVGALGVLGFCAHLARRPSPLHAHTPSPSPTPDELIRQVTIHCAERGALLIRIRDELQGTLRSYQELYESAM